MTRRLAPPLVAVFALVLAFAGNAASVHAEATVDASGVEPQYPRALNFKLTASAPADITEVTLNYAITGRGTSALARASELTPGRTISVTVPVQTNTGSSYIPPGSDFTYHWEIETADGATTVTPEATYTYLPPGKDWQSVSSEIMKVYYYGDRKATAETYLKAGDETYERIGRQLLNTELKLKPVKVILFPVESELEQARPGRSETLDAATLTCGTKVASDIVLVIPQSCGSADPTDTLRHEFGHILNEAAGEGALGKLPSWVDEGTAVYAQTSAGAGYVNAATSAARANRFIPFNQMGTPTNNASLTNLFYGQSYLMVKYLIDKSGPAKYAEFMAAIKGGSRFDQALQQIYGFSLAQFEQEFTTNGGQVRGVAGGQAPATVAPTQAPPRQAATPTLAPTQRASQASPTAAPPTAAAQASNGGSDGGSIGASTIAIVGVSVIFALLAVFSFLISMMLQNNRTRGDGSPPPPTPG